MTTKRAAPKKPRAEKRDWLGCFVRPPCGVCGAKICTHQSMAANARGYYHERCARDGKVMR